MIQYKYFHTTSGYVSKCSLEDAAARRYYEGLFENIRTAIGNDSFTYATIKDGSFVFMQTENNVSHGLCGCKDDGIAERPAAYINKLDNNAKPDEYEASALPDGSLPAIKAKDSFSLAANLNRNIFAKLTDALLFGEPNKQIVIFAESRAAAVNYIKTLSLTLPLRYMKKIGFCVCSGDRDIPSDAIGAVTQDGTKNTISIKIWASSLTSFDFNSYSRFYYVFDIKGNRDNYGGDLSAIAKIIAETDFGNDTILSDLAEQIEEAFDGDGRIKPETLEKIAVQKAFEIKRNSDTAKAVLKISQTAAIDVPIIINAVAELLGGSNADKLTVEDRRLILKVCVDNANIDENTKTLLYDFYEKNYNGLEQEEKSYFFQLLSTKQNMEKFLTAPPQIRDFSARVKAFKVACEVIDRKVSEGNVEIFSLMDLLTPIIKAFDISKVRGVIPLDQMTASGEEFFKVISECKDERTQEIMSAALMFSAYKKNMSPALCDIRIKGLKKYFQVGNIEAPLDRLDFIIRVRDKIFDIDMEIQKPKSGGGDFEDDFEIGGYFNFLIGTSSGKGWVKDEIVKKFSVEDALNAYKIVSSAPLATRIYRDMIGLLEEDLLNLDYVKTNVTVASKADLIGLYKDFFNDYVQANSSYNFPAKAEISDYLKRLDSSAKINEAYKQDRLQFSGACFQTFSNSDKNKTIRSLDADGQKPKRGSEENFDYGYLFADISDEKKTQITEKTAEVFGVTKKSHIHRINDKKKAELFVIRGFLFSVCSILILISPAVIQSLTLGINTLGGIAARIADRASVADIVLPICVYLLYAGAYIVLRRTFKRKDATEMADKITFLFGIGPVLIFAAGSFGSYYFW
ncbi:MAG: hypothetical protein LBP62_05940 [Clostridiales bacterium]|nr:hypothetical protein [Clostridiales bacterium]